MSKFPIGVLYGQDISNLYQDAKDNNYAIPSVNVTGTNSINAALESAKEVNSPIIIQVSHGGAAFIAGKSLDNTNHHASILGSISMALHIHNVVKDYGVSVIIHSDHCAKKLLPWFDGMLEADIKYYQQHGRPLFSSHMTDLSLESLQDNIAISKNYFKKMVEYNLFLELEIGMTGGEEDGVDNSNADSDKLYTQPQDIEYAYNELHAISDQFQIAAAFGNVHGAYKPGAVHLKPELLKKHQDHIQKVYNTQTKKPLNLVFHGGSGSDKDKIKEALSYGVVKFNIDTDTQWAFWDGVRHYERDKHEYLMSQIGAPNNPDQPNKKYYDPRAWLRAGEQSIVNRLKIAYQDLNAINRN